MVKTYPPEIQMVLNEIMLRGEKVDDVIDVTRLDTGKVISEVPTGANEIVGVGENLYLLTRLQKGAQHGHRKRKRRRK